MKNIKFLRGLIPFLILIMVLPLFGASDEKKKDNQPPPPPKKAATPRPATPPHHATPPPTHTVPPAHNTELKPAGTSGTKPNIHTGGTPTNVRNPGTYPPTGTVGTKPNIHTGGTPTNVRNPSTYPPTGTTGTNPNIHPGGTGSNIRTPSTNPAVRTTGVNPNIHPGGTGSNIRTPGTNPAVRTTGVNPNIHTTGAYPNIHTPGTAQPTHIVTTRTGGKLEVTPNGRPTHFVGSAGQEARFSPAGKISQIHDPRRGMTIEHGYRSGERRIVTEQNGRRLVSEGPNRGYLERPYVNRYGRTYYQRTYWDHGHSYVYVYRDHYYYGAHYPYYVPAYYYHPVFYGWVYNPWPAPVHFYWGWNVQPWYGYYGPYFAPAPVYLTASLWLTDFLLAENLKAAYEARKAAEARNQAAPPPEGETAAAVPLSPEVKEAIQAEVQRQLAAERAAADHPAAPSPAPATGGTEGPPAALDPKQRLFVVSSDLDVITTDGQECGLSGGDVITRIDDTPDADGKVRVSVLSSKPNDCAVGSMPKVAAGDLQEMHNNFREQLDSGLKTLASNQGKSGLPPAPDAATSPGEVAAPPPDSSVDRSLQEQQSEAAQVESEVQQQVQTGPPTDQ